MTEPTGRAIVRTAERVRPTLPKRQRTITVTIMDRGTTACLIATLTIRRRSVELKSGIFLTASMDDTEANAAYDRVHARCVRLGFLLQTRWFGESGRERLRDV